VKTFYVASRLENAPQVKELIFHLQAAGWLCKFDWTQRGVVRGDHEMMVECAEDEAWAAYSCDALVFLLPGGRGAHVELGIHIGRRMGYPLNQDSLTFVYSEAPDQELGLGERTSVFYHLPKVTQVAGPMMMNELAALVVRSYPEETEC
jgi:hypothetical protein